MYRILIKTTYSFGPIDRIFLHILQKEDQINHIRLVVKI